MPLDRFPLTNRMRFQFDKAPTARRVRKGDERLRGPPEAPLTLHADGEGFERSEQRHIARRAASHYAKGTPGRPTRQSLG